MVQIKLENVRSMFENRQACFRKLADKQVRPVQLVAPRPECTARSKSPLFSPKHGNLHLSSIIQKYSLVSNPGEVGVGLGAAWGRIHPEWWAVLASTNDVTVPSLHLHSPNSLCRILGKKTTFKFTLKEVLQNFLHPTWK